jgi:hypothetical protein
MKTGCCHPEVGAGLFPVAISVPAPCERVRSTVLFKSSSIVFHPNSALFWLHDPHATCSLMLRKSERMDGREKIL